MRSRAARRRAGPVLLLCAVLTAGLVPACSDGEPSSADPPTTTAPTTTTAPSTISPEEEDEQALRQLAQEWYEVVRQIFVDGEDPSLAEDYIAGPYLEEFRQHVLEDDAAGHITERDPEGRSRTTVESVEVDGDEAEIVECLVDADVLKEEATGEVVDDEVAASRLRTVAAKGHDGWRLTQRRVLSETLDAETCTAQ